MARAAAFKPAGFEQIEAAFVQNPVENAAAYGFALCRAGRANEAIEALGKLHALAPLKGQGRLALARAYFDTFAIDQAAELLKDMPASWHNDPSAQRLMAEIALEKDDQTAAKQLVRRSFELDPRDARTREMMIFLGEISPQDLSAEAMTDEATIREEDEDDTPPAKPRTLARSLKWGAVTVVVLGLIVAVYAWRVRTQAEISRIIAVAKPVKGKGDLQSLQKADKLYKDALALDASHPVVLGALTEIHALLFTEHGVDASKVELAQWLGKARAAGSHTGSRFVGEGLGIIIAGSPERAEITLLQTLEKGAVDGRVLYALGMAQRAQGKQDIARDTLRRAYELEPFQPTFAVDLGDTFLIDSDLKNAESFWRKAADANPEHSRAVSRALIGRLLLGEEPAVIAPLADALAKKEISPAHRGALLALQAELALAQGKDAVKLMRDAKGLRPYDPAIEWMLGQVMVQAGNNKEALVSYDALIKHYSGLKQLPIEAAFLAARLGKPEDGEQRLKANKDLSPARLEALSANILLRAGDLAAAQTRAEKALKADPASAEAHYVLGRVLQSKREYPKALDQFSQALQTKATYPELYEQVGLIYIDNKEYDQAIDNLAQAEKQFLQSAAPFPTLARVYEELARAYDLRGGPNAKIASDRYRARAKRKI